MSRRKLEARLFAPAVIPYLLVSLGDRVARWGIDPARLCAGLGFDLADLRAGLPVSNRQAWRMIRRALQISGRADLGFEVGRGQDLSCFGVLGEALAVAPDVGTALAVAARYHPAGGALLDVDAEQGDDRMVLTLRPRLRDPQVVMFLVEELLSSVWGLFQHELGVPLALESLALAYPRPAHAERYQAQFGCLPRFAAERTVCRIARPWLRQAVPGHDPERFDRLCAALRQPALVRDLDAMGAVEALLARPGHAAMSLPEAARALDLSERTLRRRLREAGTSWRVIHDRVRARAARRMLQEDGLTVARIARRLGFADAHAFRRAFGRWWGCTPGQMRARPAQSVRTIHLAE